MARDGRIWWQGRADLVAGTGGSSEILILNFVVVIKECILSFCGITLQNDIFMFPLLYIYDLPVV